jgi:hypothetical protein
MSGTALCSEDIFIKDGESVVSLTDWKHGHFFSKKVFFFYQSTPTLRVVYTVVVLLVFHIQ